MSKSRYSLNGLRYGKKEFLSGCESDGIYDVPHPTCQPISCTLEDAPIARMIEFSGGFLPSSSPVVRSPDEWLKYQCGEGHTLSEIPDSSDLFTMTCLDGKHTMTHCNPVQCGVPPVIAHENPTGEGVVLLPSPTESRSSTSAMPTVMQNRSASLGRSQKAAMRRSVLSQCNLCRHQKSQ